MCKSKHVLISESSTILFNQEFEKLGNVYEVLAETYTVQPNGDKSVIMRLIDEPLRSALESEEELNEKLLAVHHGQSTDKR